MTARQILDRLSLQRAYPEHYTRCVSCPPRTVGRCAQCLGTGKVTVATARALAEGRAIREYA